MALNSLTLSCEESFSVAQQPPGSGLMSMLRLALGAEWMPGV